MTELLTPDGRVIDVEWGWLFNALDSWLRDRTVQDCILRANIATPFHLAALRRLLDQRRKGRPVVDSKLLKQAAYDFLGDRNTRKRIARAIMREQERQVGLWAKDVDRWLRTPEGEQAGPRPERPERQGPKELIEELLQVRKELERDLRLAPEVAQPTAG